MMTPEAINLPNSLIDTISTWIYTDYNHLKSFEIVWVLVLNFKAVRSYWVELGLGFGPKLLVRLSAKIGSLGKHMYIFGFKSSDKFVWENLILIQFFVINSNILQLQCNTGIYRYIYRMIYQILSMISPCFKVSSRHK